MEIFPAGSPSLLAPFLDHLWQSTAFGGSMAVAALALRKNRAAVRFWLWLAASMKFLVPCALLMELGELVRKQPALTATPQIERWTAIQDAGQAVFTPSSAIVTATTPAHSHADIWFAVIAAVWVCGFLFVAFRWLRQWRAIRSLVRNAKPIDLGLPIPSVSAAARLEPGVFGIFRPVLFLPEGISARLTPEQMQALFAHELCHVRRRDNLWAAVHVLVEAIFWFHPLVWWLGARMIAERETACDEAVLQSGAEAEAYATSVLEVCRIYAASPMPAIAGITGADLKQRVITIASRSFGRSLSRGKKLTLAFAAIGALATPIVFGLVSLPLVRALDKDEIARLPRFEVVSVKPFVPIPGQRPTPPGIYPGGRVVLRGVVQGLLTQAFQVAPFQISGLPDWATNQRGARSFEIEALLPDSSPSKRFWHC
jgi:beta-lactamase regulating signal transducer with metallopeptidase domain